MPKKSFYTAIPTVPGNKVAGVNPVGAVQVGPPTPVQIDVNPAVAHGVGPNTKNVKPLPIVGARRYQHVARHTRMGKPHQIGKK